MTNISSSLVFNSGNVLKNRIAKSAMSENMAKNYIPLIQFENSYATWAMGGLGLCITGNVMIDREHLGEFNNVVLDDKVHNLAPFFNWSKAGKLNDTLLYMQLNHPGKQSPKFLNIEPVAPSAIAFDAPMGSMFNKPKELSELEILDIVDKFATSADLAKSTGFDGIQIHAAHGYLISQFLSPKHNQRKDQWGGCLENRMRILVEIFKAVKEKVGNNFGVAVKLNSADFQKGGFSEEDSMEVVKKLDTLGLDFIEISGGTYEVNAMMGKKSKKDDSPKESTQKREAYFINYAKKIHDFIKTPLMVTGGFRNKETISEALESGNVDIVGMGRPFTIYPDLANNLLGKEDFSWEVTPKKTGLKLVDAMIPLEITWYTQQIHRLGNNKKPCPNKGIWTSVIGTLLEFGLQGLKRSRS